MASCLTTQEGIVPTLDLNSMWFTVQTLEWILRVLEETGEIHIKGYPVGSNRSVMSLAAELIAVGQNAKL